MYFHAFISLHWSCITLTIFPWNLHFVISRRKNYDWWRLNFNVYAWLKNFCYPPPPWITRQEDYTTFSLCTCSLLLLLFNGNKFSPKAFFIALFAVIFSCNLFVGCQPYSKKCSSVNYCTWAFFCWYGGKLQTCDSCQNASAISIIMYASSCIYLLNLVAHILVL